MFVQEFKMLINHKTAANKSRGAANILIRVDPGIWIEEFLKLFL